MTAETIIQPNHCSVRFLSDIARDLSKGEIEFPTFINATFKIRSALDDPNMDTERLARVISTEPLLAAKLVHLANSAALNPSGRPIADVATAVARIGLQSVRAIATAVAMNQMRAAAALRTYRDRTEAIWKHSVQVAAMSFMLARKFTRYRPDEALFVGLVHDIGHFYLLSIIDRYPELRADSVAFDACLRDWHAPIGQAVLQSFKLSDSALEAIADHEVPLHGKIPKTMLDIISTANLMSAQTNPIYRNVSVLPEISTDPKVVEAMRESEEELVSLASALQV